jgi:hypothetical protein
MGAAAEKTFYVGQSLNDDIYHTLVFKRRANKVRVVVDDDAPVLGEHSLHAYNIPAYIKTCVHTYIKMYIHTCIHT